MKTFWATVMILFFVTTAGAADKLRVATWNLRWLNSAEYAPDGSKEAERTEADYDKLQEYASSLDADVIAFQEVGDSEAAYRVFPKNNYTVVLSGRNNHQQTGFAIKKEISFKNNGPYTALGAGNVRYGTDITIYPETQKALRLLCVHLKSGCFSNNEDASSDEYKKKTCSKFTTNLNILEEWIDERSAEKIPYVVLGDWNRRLLNSGDRAWIEIDDGVPVNSDLENANATVFHSKCTVKTWNRRNKKWNSTLKNYPKPIDHIVLDARSAHMLVKESFNILTYMESDSHNYNLSDHCPAYADLTLTQQ